MSDSLQNLEWFTASDLAGESFYWMRWQGGGQDNYDVIWWSDLEPLMMSGATFGNGRIDSFPSAMFYGPLEPPK